MKTREQIIEEVSELGSRDLYTYQCEYCHKECTRIVKNIRKGLHKADGFYCSITCRGKAEKWTTLPCSNCGTPVDRLISQLSTSGNVFCSHSCAAAVSNKGRVLTEETKKKISESGARVRSLSENNLKSKVCKFCQTTFLTKFRTDVFCSDDCQENHFKLKVKHKNAKRSAKRKIKREDAANNRPLFTPIKFVECKECLNIFLITNMRSQAQYCSEDCRSKSMSRQMSERLSKAENRVNLGRGKPSWMESSFSEWLDSYNVSYKTEVQFKNHDSGKFYYADFVFDSISLIIELDGNHHRFTVEKDQIRDAYLKSYYNFDVYRVTHKEYRSKVKLPEIKELLGIKE